MSQSKLRTLLRGGSPKGEHNKQVLGFYSYTFAAEVFSCVTAAVFLPIALEQLARRHGYFDCDLSRPCWDIAPTASESACSVRILGSWVDTASYSLFVKSASVAVQAATVISISVLADNAFWRKRLLVSFAFVGSLSCLCFLFLPPSSKISILFSTIFAITSVVCFGDSFVCLNSFLPNLVQNAPEVVAARLNLAGPGGPDEDIAEARIVMEEETALLSEDDRTGPIGVDSEAGAFVYEDHSDALTRYRSVVSFTASRISSLGIAIGYSSGTSILALMIIPVSLMKGSIFSLHLAISITGVWWAIFTIPAALFLPSQRINERDQVDGDFVKEQVKEGWERLGKMTKTSEIRRLRATFWYLLAWALLADAFNTFTSIAILFAKTSLGMSSSGVIVIGILTQATAIVSAFSTPAFQKRFNLSSMTLMVYSVAGVIVMCAYVLVGLIGDLRYGGLKTSGEMYACAIWFGIMFGPFNALSRTVFAELIPPGHEARFFSLFSICDKGASWLGPGVIAIIADRTGEIRYGFIFLVALLATPIPILLFLVDVEQGRQDAAVYAQEETR